MRECRHTRPDWCRHPAQGLRHSLYRQFRWEHTKSGSFLDRLKNNKYVHFSCLTFCHWFSFQFNKHVWGFGPSCELFEFLCVLLGIKIGFGWAFWYQTIKWRWFWNFLHIKSGTRCRPASTVYSTIMWMCIRLLAVLETPLVDVSSHESSSGGPELTLAAHPKSGQIVLLEMSHRDVH